MREPGFIKTYDAEAAIAIYRIVKFGTAAKQVLQAAANTDKLIGVIELAASINERVDVVRSGFAEVEYGGNVTKGDHLTSDADGKAVKLTDTMLESGACWSLGIAEESGVSGDIGSLFINPHKISKFDEVTASAAEINTLADVTAGTVSASKALVVNAAKHLNEVNTTKLSLGASGSAVEVTASAAELNTVDVTAGTVTAGKALVADAEKHVSEINTTKLSLGASGSAEEVTATAAELNTLADVTPGTVAASSAVVVDANKHVDEVNTASLKIGATGATVAVTATPAELNLLDLSAQTEAITEAGAVSVTKRVTKLTESVGGYAVSLAAPDATMLGQVKVITMIARASGAITMALTNVVGGSQTTSASFDAVDETLTLLAGVNKWIVLDEHGVTLS